MGVDVSYWPTASDVTARANVGFRSAAEVARAFQTRNRVGVGDTVARNGACKVEPFYLVSSSSVTVKRQHANDARIVLPRHRKLAPQFN
jgi:hypothetical protein